MKTIAIIGAGAAGLMSAATILEETTKFLPSQEWREDFHIHLFEKNTSPGKKVIISWGGRCNVTTGITDKKILSTKYTRGWDWIEHAMGKFSPKKCREWFESHGVPLKCEEDNRVFPVSDDGRDIVWVFERIFVKYRDKITLHYGEGVDAVSVISTELPVSVVTTRDSAQIEQDFSIPLSLHSKWQIQQEQQKQQEKYLITTPKWSYEADVLIVATGGNAYSHTGSTGDGYAFARALGHTVTPLWPSLSSFLTDNKWLHELSGLAFEEAQISFLSSRRDPFQNNVWKKDSQNLLSEWKSDSFTTLRNDKIEQKLTWSLLLTHFGISWPLTFMVSSHLAFEEIGKWATKEIRFAPIASMSREIWEHVLRDSFARNPKKLLINIISDHLPRRFAEAFIWQYFTHIRETFAGSIGKKDREMIASLLGDGIVLTLLERRPGDEFVTAGGISTDEIDPETMESKLHKNLYFAGEILNVDGYTWGFSLQICWASGNLVGKSILLK